MARYPVKTPSFATKPYGATEDVWEQAKDQARAVLYEWAAAGRYGYYTELADRVTAITWLDGEAFGGQIGWMLGQLSLEELTRDEDRPCSARSWLARSSASQPTVTGSSSRTSASQSL